MYSRDLHCIYDFVAQSAPYIIFESPVEEDTSAEITWEEGLVKNKPGNGMPPTVTGYHLVDAQGFNGSDLVGDQVTCNRQSQLQTIKVSGDVHCPASSITEDENVVGLRKHSAVSQPINGCRFVPKKEYGKLTMRSFGCITLSEYVAPASGSLISSKSTILSPNPACLAA